MCHCPAFRLRLCLTRTSTYIQWQPRHSHALTRPPSPSITAAAVAQPAMSESLPAGPRHLSHHFDWIAQLPLHPSIPKCYLLPSEIAHEHSEPPQLTLRLRFNIERSTVSKVCNPRPQLCGSCSPLYGSIRGLPRATHGPLLRQRRAMQFAAFPVSQATKT